MFPANTPIFIIMRSGVQVSLSLQKKSPQTKSEGLFSFWSMKACFQKDKRENDLIVSETSNGLFFVKLPSFDFLSLMQGGEKHPSRYKHEILEKSWVFCIIMSPSLITYSWLFSTFFIQIYLLRSVRQGMTYLQAHVRKSLSDMSTMKKRVFSTEEKMQILWI